MDYDNPKIFNFDKSGNIVLKNEDQINFSSFYNIEKLNTLYKNLDTISFLEILTEKINSLQEDMISQLYLRE